MRAVSSADTSSLLHSGVAAVVGRAGTGKTTGLAAAGALRVRFDEKLAELDHRFLAQPTHDGRPALEHGYALTAYAAQGLTCRHALVLARDEAYSEWIYTTMTRASDANRLTSSVNAARSRRVRSR